MSESGFTRKFVFPAEGATGLTMDTADARYARNPIIRTGGTDARSHEDHFGDTGKNPADYGTVGKDILTDDTAAIQDAIDWFKNPDSTNFPGTFKTRSFHGRVLNLAGGTYGIGSTLNFDNTYGMSLCNGTLVAIGSGWGSSPMLQGDLGLAMTVKELTLECNERANGILANRCVHSAWQDINIWGCGTESYGFSSTTASAGLLMKLNRVSVYGTIGAETVATSGYTATGFLLSGGSDCSMQNCETNRVLVGAHIYGGGWRIINCHFTGSGDAAVQNDVGLKLEAGQYNQVIGCNFDHSILYLRGVGRRLVSGCMFRSDTADKLTCAVQWEATAAAQRLSGAIIVDNYSSLTGDVADISGIELIEAGGNSFDGVDRLVIGRNLSQTQSALLPKPKTTFGTTDVNVLLSDWRGNVVNVDMSDILLHPMPPTHATRLSVNAAAQSYVDGAFFMGAVYDRATALLSLTFSQAFEGRIRVDYQWGDQYERLNAEAPVSGPTTQWEEKGTWTPVLTFATPGNLAVTYTTQAGHYEKIGDVCRVFFTIITSAFTHTTASGNASITGLPFISENTTNNESRAATHFQGITKAGYTSVILRNQPGSASLTMLASGSGVASATIDATDMPSGGTVNLGGTLVYRV